MNPESGLIIGLICARGGSQGVPRKNIRLLAGKPLIAHSIEFALASKMIDRTIVSTEDEEIAKIARDYGAEVPFMRPVELAQDHSSSIAVVEHAISWLGEHEKKIPGYVMLLQPTSPFRTDTDIDEVVKISREHKRAAVVSLTESCCHPFLTKRILENGSLVDFSDESSKQSDLSRQRLPRAYKINGSIYLNSCESLLHDKTFFPKETFAYIMPKERSIDIDTEYDFYLAELILKNKK